MQRLPLIGGDGSPAQRLSSRRPRDNCFTITIADFRRQASFADYVVGLMGTTDRKSMEPMAAVASGDETRCSGAHQRIQHFISDSEWDDRAIRLDAARHAIAAMERHEPISTWIIDDTGFLKQGKHSVGVQRQYTGSAGKTANCQIGVSLSVATSRAHVPIDFELFLPVDWADDAAAAPSRPAIQRLADKVSAVFVPAVVAIAITTFAVWMAVGPAPRGAHALVAAVSVLIIACPCALGG